MFQEWKQKIEALDHRLLGKQIKLKSERPPPKFNFEPSSMGQCIRKQVMDWLRLPFSNPRTEVEMRHLDYGNAIHEYAARQLSFRFARVPEYRNKEASPIAVSYSMDNIAYIQSDVPELAYFKEPKLVVFEVKSSKEYIFRKVQKSAENGENCMSEDYYTQLQTYLYFHRDIDCGIFWYVNKNDPMWLFIKCDRDVDYFEGHVVDKCNRIREYVANEEIPDPDVDIMWGIDGFPIRGESHYLCAFCPRRTQCYEMDRAAGVRVKDVCGKSTSKNRKNAAKTLRQVKKESGGVFFDFTSKKVPKARKADEEDAYYEPDVDIYKDLKMKTEED